MPHTGINEFLLIPCFYDGQQRNEDRDKRKENCGDCAGHGFHYFSGKKTLQEGGKRYFNILKFVALTESEM